MYLRIIMFVCGTHLPNASASIVRDDLASTQIILNTPTLCELKVSNAASLVLT